MLKDKKRGFIVAGFSELWVTLMDNISAVPSVLLDEISPSGLNVNSVLEEIVVEPGTGEYKEAPLNDTQGLKYEISINLSNLNITREKDFEINKLMKKKLFVLFRTNNGQLRYVIDAMLSNSTSSGSFENGSPGYSLSFLTFSEQSALYYDGSVVDNGNGTVTLRQ